MSPLTPDELLTTTRAVRRRLDLSRPVPLSLVREAIEVALQAPNGDNGQHWHWLVVTDPAQRSAVARWYRRASDDFSLRAQPPGELPAATQRIRRSAQFLYDHLPEVPVLVIPCLDAPRLPEGSQAGLWGSLLPAAWSFMLAARARGLGTAWTGLHLRYEQEVAAALGLPDGIRQGVLIPVGFYTGASFRPAPRRPVDEVMHLDRW